MSTRPSSAMLSALANWPCPAPARTETALIARGLLRRWDDGLVTITPEGRKVGRAWLTNVLTGVPRTPKDPSP